LTMAGFIVKILGALYRIPLANLIKDEGMGLYQMAYPIYTTLLAISTAGFPTAVSKLVSERLALKDQEGAYAIFKQALLILFVMGLTASSILFIFAKVIAESVLVNPKAYYSLIAVSPALTLVALMGAFRGYFQGMQIMYPTAVSQIVEQAVRVVFVLLLAYLLMPYGVEYAAAGASAGAAIGALFGLLFLLTIYVFKRKSLISGFRRKNVDGIGIIKRLIMYAIPVTLGSLVVPLGNLADAAIVPLRLKSIGLDVKTATELFGILTGEAAPLVNFPSIVTVAIATSLLPAISESHALGDYKSLNAKAVLAIKATLMIGLPAAAGLGLLSTPIMHMLFGEEKGGSVLAILSFSIIFLTLIQTLTSILQGIGRVTLPVINLAIGGAVKITLNFILTGIAFFNIRGAATATVMGYLVTCLLDFLCVRRCIQLRIDFKDDILKPLLSTIIMLISVALSYNAIYFIANSISKSTLLSIIVGVIVYSLSLIITGTIKKDEMELLPGGRRLYRLLRKLKIIGG